MTDSRLREITACMSDLDLTVVVLIDFYKSNGNGRSYQGSPSLSIKCDAINIYGILNAIQWDINGILNAMQWDMYGKLNVMGYIRYS